MSSHYQNAYFLLSVADVKQLPPDNGREVAIVGRSNAGKSSILNCLTQQKNLARTSKTPGRTQLINLFVIEDERRLADLPGYGYAKAPLAAKQKWQEVVDLYLRTRKSLQGVLLVMDIRHPLQSLDMQFLEYCSYYHLPVHILLNKEDKLSKSAVIKTLREVKSLLTGMDNSVSVQSFSALKGLGVKSLHVLLNQWYDY